MERLTASALFFLLLHLVTLTTSQQLFAGDVCRTSSGLSGVCKRIDACQSAIDDFYKGKEPTICSYDKRTAVVCCPSTATPKPTPRPTPRPATIPANIVDREGEGVGKKSREMCQKYSALVWHEESEPTLSLIDDEPSPRVNVSDCGVPDYAELIIGGEPAASKEFPHMAAIGFGDEKSIAWLCGGTLISERFILTAAHCVRAGNRGLAKWVRVGDLNLARSDDDARPQQLSVVERIRHPNYSSFAHYDDIALLRTDRSVQMNAYVRPACLNVVRNVATEYYQASGWGLVEWDAERGSDSLMKVNLFPVSLADCSRAYKSLSNTNKLKHGIKDEMMVCAGVKEGGKDTCRGDSGGPLQIVLKEPFCMYSIVGLTSFGSTVCGAQNSPAVYTRVYNYIPWIESIVWG